MQQPLTRSISRIRRDATDRAQKLNAIRLFSNIGGSMLPIDDLDQRLVAQIDSLLLNILLYMSEIPVEHEPKELDEK